MLDSVLQKLSIFLFFFFFLCCFQVYLGWLMVRLLYLPMFPQRSSTSTISMFFLPSVCLILFSCLKFSLKLCLYSFLKHAHTISFYYLFIFQCIIFKFSFIFSFIILCVLISPSILLKNLISAAVSLLLSAFSPCPCFWSIQWSGLTFLSLSC